MIKTGTVATSVYLVRHAQSANNAKAVEQRCCDPSITRLGEQQAEMTARLLGELEFESLVCSAFRRALQTAQWIGRCTRLTPEVIVAMHEHGGCYEGWNDENFVGRPGLTAGEIHAEFGDVQLPADFPESGWWQSSSRESQEASGQRAFRMVELLKSRLKTGNGNLVCVTHADFLNKILQAMFGVKIRSHESFPDLKNTGVTQVGLEENEWKLYQLNSVEHLPESLVTP